jgi:hypothetical protein
MLKKRLKRKEQLTPRLDKNILNRVLQLDVDNYYRFKMADDQEKGKNSSQPISSAVPSYWDCSCSLVFPAIRQASQWLL